jgi:hypothetical protein
MALESCGGTNSAAFLTDVVEAEADADCECEPQCDAGYSIGDARSSTEDLPTFTVIPPTGASFSLEAGKTETEKKWVAKKGGLPAREVAKFMPASEFYDRGTMRCVAGHLFVPKCVADACEFTAKMLPQFANGRDTFKGGLYPSETTCDEASINHPYFDLKLPKDVAIGDINDVPFDDDRREYGGLKSMTIASGTHCHVACKSNALGVDAKNNPIPSAYVPADVSCNAGVLTMGECEPAFCYLLDRRRRL